MQARLCIIQPGNCTGEGVNDNIQIIIWRGVTVFQKNPTASLDITFISSHTEQFARINCNSQGNLRSTKERPDQRGRFAGKVTDRGFHLRAQCVTSRVSSASNERRRQTLGSVNKRAARLWADGTAIIVN